MDHPRADRLIAKTGALAAAATSRQACASPQPARQHHRLLTYGVSWSVDIWRAVYERACALRGESRLGGPHAGACSVADACVCRARHCL